MRLWKLVVAAGLVLGDAPPSQPAPSHPAPTLRSFEEWRIHNLLQSGQDIGSAHGTAHTHAGGSGGPGGAGEPALDPFTGEIDFLFAASDEPGKTYKDRFNYASFDCGATVVKSNKDVKGAGAILVENKDSYLLNKCVAGSKHVIIELCQDILVDQVVVGNYEFFSSMFKEIRISVADRYPVASGEWRVLGDFTADNIRDLQTFDITVPQIWARYVKIEFLSHWGHEYYCPISVVRVHGTTMMEEWKRSGGEGVPEAGGAAGSGEVQEPEYERKEPHEETENVIENNNPSLNHTVIEKGECLPKLSLDKVKLGLNEYCRLDEFYRKIERNNSTNNTDTSASGSSVNSTSTPPTQESIYKTIMKRLSLLESNATLSLQYVEEQSKVLRDLLYKIEKKQNSKIDDFLFHFNATVLQQLLMFSQQREQKLNRALLELDFQKSQTDKNMAAISQRFALLADDLVFQKRMTMFQGLILLVVLLFVALTRGTGPEFSRRNRLTLTTDDSEDNSDFGSFRRHLRRNFKRNISNLSPRWSLNLSPQSPVSDEGGQEDLGLDTDSDDGQMDSPPPPRTLGSPLNTPGPKKKKSRSLYDEPVKWEGDPEPVGYMSPEEDDDNDHDNNNNNKEDKET
ncbi:hypothetical protein CJU90_1612 [Yarrowia sp. C11]|nr:hypothetical protein CKK34_0336 [Yarrowia sp. E02]KAG5371573.1 hypothetical protein CJU90_1612 [Yarrowia sp. C11]